MQPSEREQVLNAARQTKPWLAAWEVMLPPKGLRLLHADILAGRPIKDIFRYEQPHRYTW